jgi:hypothetical protein
VLFSAYRDEVVYGIDWAESRVVVVRSARARGRLEHTVVLDQAGPEAGAALTQWAADLKADFESGRVATAVAMPVSQSFTRWLQTPLKSPAKARKVLPSLLDIQLPFPLESCLYHFPKFRRVPNAGIDALAVAAPLQNITNRLDAFRAKGIDPVVLDHEGLALWSQSCTELPLERNALRIVAYLGEDRAVLALGRDSDLISAHSLRQGLGEGSQETADRFALRVRQILQSQPAEVTGSPIQWLWTGPGAERQEWIGVLQERLREFGELRFAVHKNPTAFLARALGERMLAQNGDEFNFRQDQLEHPAASRQRQQQSVRVLSLCLAAGILLCVVNLSWQALLNRQLARSQSALSSLAADLSGMSKVPKGQEIMMVQRSLEQQDALLKPFLDSLAPSSQSKLIRILQIAFNQKIQIEKLSLQPGSISLAGSSEDWDRCETFAKEIRAEGYDINLSRQEAGADERVHFTIQGGSHAL